MRSLVLKHSRFSQSKCRENIPGTFLFSDFGCIWGNQDECKKSVMKKTQHRLNTRDVFFPQTNWRLLRQNLLCCKSLSEFLRIHPLFMC